MSIVYFPLASFTIARPRISSANTSTFPLASGSLPFTSDTLPRLSRIFFNCVLLFSSSVPPTAFFISSCIDFTVSYISPRRFENAFMSQFHHFAGAVQPTFTPVVYSEGSSITVAFFAYSVIFSIVFFFTMSSLV